MCGNSETIQEFFNPGDSQSRFFVTDDEKYILKTIPREELDAYRAHSVQYHNKVVSSSGSFFVKVYGIYSYQIAGSEEFILMIMNNLMVPGRKITTLVDIKGSKHGRNVIHRGDGRLPTLRDNDLTGYFLMRTETFRKFTDILDSDIKELELYGATDFSLLFALHEHNDEDEPSTSDGGKKDWWGELYKRDDISLYEI